MTARLIKTFAPFGDESGLGYYRRLSSENALSGWKELARLCEVPVVKTGLLARPQHVAESLGLEPAWSRLASSQDETARGWQGRRRLGGDAVCPHCLRESPYLRVSWEHAYMVACPTHKVLLSDTCSACGERLTSTRELIAHCSCGHDLRSLAPLPATEAQLWLASLIDSAGASSGEWLPKVEGAPLDLIAMLSQTLCLLYDPKVSPPRSNSAAPRTIREGVEFLGPLEDLLADWPRSFEAHVSSRILNGRAEARTLNTLLGKWYHQLRALSECEPLQPFLEAVGRVASVEFTGVLGLDAAASVVTKGASHLVLTQAARLVGMHRDTLATYVKRGQLPHRTKKLGTRGQVYEVSVEEMNAVVQAREGWMDEEAAGQLLGVPPSVLQRLIDAELLVSDPHWRRDLRKGGPVERASIVKLIALLRSHRAVSAGLEGRRIALRELSSRRAGDKKAITAALRAIAAGEIRPVGASESVGGLQFPMAEVARHFSRPTLDAGLSVQALSELTGWKWESINHWIEAGMLESDDIVLRGQSCRVVMPSQLLDFCRTYIPLADLAREVASKSSAMHDRLQGIEVVGSQLLPSGQQRGGLVRIGDLARVALSKLKPSYPEE